ncbi:MAG: SirB2 family protein [Spongiibacteraceae bacterium]|jgi:uncharacterized membrane protein SirB2|nr:SirB2 family protein [Spongiibacteraceae bacterium]
MYLALKHSHMMFAVLSVLFFIVRGGMKLAGSNLLQNKLIKVLPHVIDTFLLLTAIGLLVTLSLNPFAVSWLTAKIIGLVVYIALGVTMMRLARTRATQAVAFVLALATFAYIMSTAFNKTPWPFG